MLNIKGFWGLFSIKPLQKTHWYDYMPFVMLKGLCQKFTIWKGLPRFVCNFKEISHRTRSLNFSFKGKYYKLHQFFYYATIAITC